MKRYHPLLQEAIQAFWKVRSRQEARQGQSSGKKDQGARSAVTGGKQLDGFLHLFRRIIEDCGIEPACIHVRDTAIPGYYRPTKEWDLLVIRAGQLIASLEFKSHVGPSFGNNFNNRVEEALGNGVDLGTAYREGAFAPSAKPWTGYFMLLEETERSTAPVAIRSHHFAPFREFADTSYADRYALLCTRLVRERLYDAACLLLSKSMPSATFREPSAEIAFDAFVASLRGRLLALAD